MFNYIRPSGIWASNSVLLSSELATIDSYFQNAVDGRGGVYSNTSELKFSGVPGVYATFLKCGDDTLGNPSFSVTGTTCSVSSNFTAGRSGGLAHTAMVRYGAVVPYANSGTTMPVYSSPSAPGKIIFSGVGDAEQVSIELLLNFNVLYSSFTIRTKASIANTSITSMSFPLATLYTYDSNGTTTSLGFVTMSAASSAAYKTATNYTITPSVAFTPSKSVRYLLHIMNEAGPNATGGYEIISVVGNGTVGGFAKTGEILSAKILLSHHYIIFGNFLSTRGVEHALRVRGMPAIIS